MVAYLEAALKENDARLVAARLPRHVVRASTALNGATALFLDTLYPGATTYANAYRGLDTFSVSQRLFAMLTERKDTLAPGDEYDLVDAWVEVLGLEDGSNGPRTKTKGRRNTWVRSMTSGFAAGKQVPASVGKDRMPLRGPEQGLVQPHGGQGG